MKIYSPNTKSPANFSKNTVKDKGEVIINDKRDIIINSKVSLTGTTIEFEPKKETQVKQKAEQRSNFTLWLDMMKIKFIERMKVYFDYEDRYKEKKEV